MSAAASTRGWRTVAVIVVVLLAVVGLVWAGGRAAGPDPQTVAPSPSPSSSSTRDPETGLRWAELSALPSQVAVTIRLIEGGGPFPYDKDGVTFRNNERILPRQSLGFYREYTVPTPGSRDRGPRRVVTGDRDRQFFYTGDHYQTFVRIRR